MNFQAVYQGIPWGAASDWLSARETLREAVQIIEPERTLLTFLHELKQARPEQPVTLTDGTHTFALMVE